MSAPVYLASDAHLGAAPDDRERAFRRWLRWAGERASTLVLNGDVFDFWFEYGSVIPRGHARLLGDLAAVVDSGVEVLFMGGNHDWWGGSFLEDEIGVTFLREPLVLELAGFRTFLAHGDGLGRGDLGYRILRTVLRSRPTRWAFHWLHPDVGAMAAGVVSKTHDRHDGPGAAGDRRSAVLEGWAREKLAEDPSLDLVVLGHTHIPVMVEPEPGRWYVNAGDWVANRSYLLLEEGHPPRLQDWSAEEERASPAART